MVSWTAPGRAMARNMVVELKSGLTSTTGSGSNVATIEPMLGMKLSRKAINPKAIASSMPRTLRMIPTNMPVKAEIMNLKATYFCTLFLTSTHMLFAGASCAEPPSSKNMRKIKTIDP